MQLTALAGAFFALLAFFTAGFLVLVAFGLIAVVLDFFAADVYFLGVACATFAVAVLFVAAFGFVAAAFAFKDLFTVAGFLVVTFAGAALVLDVADFLAATLAADLEAGLAFYYCTMAERRCRSIYRSKIFKM